MWFVVHLKSSPKSGTRCGASWVVAAKIWQQVGGHVILELIVVWTFQVKTVRFLLLNRRLLWGEERLWSNVSKWLTSPQSCCAALLAHRSAIFFLCTCYCSERQLLSSIFFFMTKRVPSSIIIFQGNPRSCS